MYRLKNEEIFVMLRYLTSGESHGSSLTAIIDGIPAGLPLISADINTDLARRQTGYGRGKRMEIEQDEAEISSGVRFGKTLGTPITLVIKNRDWINWQDKMSIEPIEDMALSPLTNPRPGHADLAGALKFDLKDIRNVLERASARETTTRVAVGSVCRKLLEQFNIKVFSYVVEIGGIRADIEGQSAVNLAKKAERSLLRCPCPEAENKIIKLIDTARAGGDSLGGIFEIVVSGVPAGLGSYSQWDTRLDGRLSRSLMSIQAIKGVEIGIGFNAARLPGSQVHDQIYYKKKTGFYRKTNHAGGIEGGMSTGGIIILRAAMKPIATLYSPLKSVDIVTKKSVKATVERSDICRVPSAAVIGEAMVCVEIAGAFLEKFGGDSMREISRNYKGYLKQLKVF
jgi:chorismate synthase